MMLLNSHVKYSHQEVIARKRNRMINRIKLRGLNQSPGQPVQQYVDALKQIAKTCEFYITCDNCNQRNDYSQEMVLDQLVQGLNGDKIKNKILAYQEEDFTLHNIEKLVMKENNEKHSRTAKNNCPPSKADILVNSTPISILNKAKSTVQQSSHCRCCLQDQSESPANGKSCASCDKPTADLNLNTVCRTNVIEIASSGAQRKSKLLALENMTKMRNEESGSSSSCSTGRKVLKKRKRKNRKKMSFEVYKLPADNTENKQKSLPPSNSREESPPKLDGPFPAANINSPDLNNLRIVSIESIATETIAENRRKEENILSDFNVQTMHMLQSGRDQEHKQDVQRKRVQSEDLRAILDTDTDEDSDLEMETS